MADPEEAFQTKFKSQSWGGDRVCTVEGQVPVVALDPVEKALSEKYAYAEAVRCGWRRLKESTLTKTQKLDLLKELAALVKAQKEKP